MVINKREQRLINRASEELKQVQANCSARLLDRKDIEDTVREAKQAFNSLGPIERKYLIKLVATCGYSVPVSYNWQAKTSYIKVTLNHYGTVASVDVGRRDADIECYGGNKDIHLQYKYE